MRTRFASTVLKILPLLLLITVAPEGIVAQELREASDLIVIAKLISTRATNERTKVMDFKPPVEVTSLETEFETELVLKGSSRITKFRFHHYRTTEDFEHGPSFVYFPPGEHPSYLMFLTKEMKGRYAASDQNYPTSSVFRLQGATGPRNAHPDPIVGDDRAQVFDWDPFWTYQLMFEEADLVVAGGWAGTEETDERCILSDFMPPFHVIGVNTQIKADFVLKGPKDIKDITLHHYKLQVPDDELWSSALQFVRIRGPQYVDGVNYPGGALLLLFLKKELDGRYAPVTGQINPAVTSVLVLGH